MYLIPSAQRPEGVSIPVGWRIIEQAGNTYFVRDPDYKLGDQRLAKPA